LHTILTYLLHLELLDLVHEMEAGELVVTGSSVLLSRLDSLVGFGFTNSAHWFGISDFVSMVYLRA
jgi:hypothetical protein